MKQFPNDGAVLTPKNRREKKWSVCFFCMILAVYVGHGIFHPGMILIPDFAFSLESVFGGESLESSQN